MDVATVSVTMNGMASVNSLSGSYHGSARRWRERRAPLADRFDRDLTDIVATQDEVVRNIVDALAIKLTRGEEQLGRHGTENVEANSGGVRANCSVAPPQNRWLRLAQCTADQSSSIRVRSSRYQSHRLSFQAAARFSSDAGASLVLANVTSLGKGCLMQKINR